MKLGKRFYHIKRKWNAATIQFSFTKKDGTELKPHRKLNQLLYLSMFEKVSKKAVKKEMEKFHKRHNN